MRLLASQYDYFSSVLSIDANHNLLTALKAAGINPSNSVKYTGELLHRQQLRSGMCRRLSGTRPTAPLLQMVCAVTGHVSRMFVDAAADHTDQLLVCMQEQRSVSQHCIQTGPLPSPLCA
jgi:Ribonuclease T2 family